MFAHPADSMSTTQPLPSKIVVALSLLERASVYVHLDPRQRAADVPPRFKKQPQLVLQIGLNMPVRIPDLRVDDEGISCTLSFNRVPFFCVVPWSSIFAMVGDDGRGMVWSDDVPVEVARQAEERARPTPPPREREVEAVATPERSDVVLYAPGGDPYRTMFSPPIEAPRGLLVRLRAFLRRRFGWFRRQRSLK
jgi:stringent starvation protein B